jgi:hypothetical protein
VILWLLLLAAEPVVDLPPEDPLVALKGTVVAAIRNCGAKPNGEIVACSPDRGYSERERRLQKLKKPKPIPGGPGITFDVQGGTRPSGPEDK